MERTIQAEIQSRTRNKHCGESRTNKGEKWNGKRQNRKTTGKKRRIRGRGNGNTKEKQIKAYGKKNSNSNHDGNRVQKNKQQ